MEVNYRSDLAKPQEESVDSKKEIKKQTAKVMALTAILLLLLLYLLIANLPALLPPREFKFEFAIFRLLKPTAVAIDNEDQLYISEPAKHRTMVFNVNGDLVKRLDPSKGKGRLKGPVGITIDDKHNEVYVADYVGRSIRVYSKEGKLLRLFPKRPFKKAYGDKGFLPLSVQLYNNKVYVAARNGLVIFGRKGALKEVWGTKREKGYGKFDFPNGLAINQKTGDIYVSDTLNRRVVAMNQKGEVKWVAGQPDKGGKLSSSFSLPRGIALDDQDRVYVADTLDHRIVVLSKDGELLSILGARGVDDGRFNFPEGIAIRGRRLLVADKGNGRAQIFTIGLNLPALPKGKGEERNYEKNFFKAKKNKVLGRVRRVRYVNGKPAQGQKM